jgi:hypothetical protein
MQFGSKSTMAIIAVLGISLLTTSCSAQWISVALADLPVLTQMALNIGTLVTTLESGKQLSSTESAAIQNISTEATRDLNLLQALYNEYKANPNGDTLHKIQNVIAGINQNLPALLQGAHISDPVLSARVTAGVNLILVTVSSFASLIPQNAAMTAQAASQKFAIPHSSDLKKQWNQQVCTPSSNNTSASILAACQVK